MMQASHFPPQPGMQMPQGHMMGGPGPGHPMQQGMQMHPGVSGPNGPVSQAGPMMGGMQPGVGPNAHALSHLQPQQAQMFQQQQHQQHMMNPALIAQQRSAQQQALMQRQQHQQMLAQQNGMAGMSFQHQMANMNPQQIAALQGNMPQQFVPLPPHLRQQMQQQQAMQQQQQQTSNPQQAAAMAHAQQQAAAHAHAQQAQHQQQQQQQQHQQQQQQQQHQQQQQQQQQQQAQQQHQAQAMQQQQAIAMQHAQSQQSNHSQSGSQGPPTTTQPAQAPLRPPSAMSHQGQASPAAQPTPQQQPQQLPQSAPQPPQQTSAPNQPPAMTQQASQQPQNQSQMQQRNPGMTPQQVAQQTQGLAQQQAARMAMMQQRANGPNPPNGQPTLKLMNFVDHLGRFNSSREQNRLEIWQGFVDKFFTETGAFIHVLSTRNSESTKMFEIVHAAMPRYFYTQFNTEVEHLQITLDGATEKSGPPESKVTCDRAKFIYTYKNQCQVVCNGRLTAFWAAGSDKMEWLQFEMQGHQQLIPRALLESLFVQEEINPLNANQSPRMNNKSKQKQRAAQMPAEPSMSASKLPSAGITEFALPPALQSYLEIGEMMNNMSSLLSYYDAHEELTPSQAMEQWNNMMATNNPPQNAMRMQGGNMPPGQGMQQHPQQGMPPGARTPSGMGQAGLPPNQQFMSPAMANSLLPNGNMSSPHLMQSHTPSPASHQMVHQQSQSGSSASQNTSPNVNNKRRRSTAKIDADDGGGPDMNGAAKVKQSPRVGGNKRVKNNN
ncbi:hypothetical protein K458DRAFT_131405 [Lentithecium fluviatile CBS 122367]|uniref:LIM-domain binding protein-domain-containing protein n=1 Tax=Lentithecium fluviatile CBS 122367 TaxID=1168545 RepID=A0A6G1JGV8_9PLEO|nr:hypothetical protein K458DRAFT_131405 [Lentithecium fluviatile CBS 122367]